MAKNVERIYTIPLRNVPRAIREVRNFLIKHMKVEHIVIDASINEKIWERGIQKIPSKIKVKATVIEEDDEKFVKAVLAE